MSFLADLARRGAGLAPQPAPRRPVDDGFAAEAGGVAAALPVAESAGIPGVGETPLAALAAPPALPVLPVRAGEERREPSPPGPLSRPPSPPPRERGDAPAAAALPRVPLRPVSPPAVLPAAPLPPPAQDGGPAAAPPRAAEALVVPRAVPAEGKPVMEVRPAMEGSAPTVELRPAAPAVAAPVSAAVVPALAVPRSREAAAPEGREEAGRMPALPGPPPSFLLEASGSVGEERVVAGPAVSGVPAPRLREALTVASASAPAVRAEPAEPTAPVEPAAPRIEVRIGRIELRAAPPPPTPNPAPPRGRPDFAEYAQARRGIGRGWY